MRQLIVDEVRRERAAIRGGGQAPVPLEQAPEPDDPRLRAGRQVERLIRTAGFEPVKVGGVDQSGRLEVSGDLHHLVVGPAESRSLIGGI